MSEKRLYAVAVNSDDTVSVVSVAVLKETPAYYYIEARRQFDWNHLERKRRELFGFSDRVDKRRFDLSARDAVKRYMSRRQLDKANAQAVAGQATKQIASANELLMHLPEEPETVGAVDPVGEKVTG